MSLTLNYVYQNYDIKKNFQNQFTNFQNQPLCLNIVQN